MTQRGLCSRREADTFIERGWVYVDGQRVTLLGAKVHPHQSIELDRRARAQQKCAVTIVLNKPIGFVSGQPEKGYPPAISLINAGSRFKGDRSKRQFNPTDLRRLAPAGRLDIDSSG
ncbi:MAG: S4 domain-containing protein, partial [Acidiferrobacterales bacterium]